MLSDAALQALFAEARDADRGQGTGPGDSGLPAGLAARILGDADDLQSGRAAAEETRRQAARAAAWHCAQQVSPSQVPAGAGLAGGTLSGGTMGGGFWAQLSQALGGGPALAGLGAMAIAGLWLGVMPPAALETSLDAFLGSSVSSNPYLVDSATAFDFLDSEG